jgi:hypothetical protein
VAAWWPHGVAHPQFAQRAHRRQVREAVGAKALHAAAFVVDANQQVGPDRLDLGVERGHLRAVLPVAGEMDHAAHQRIGQAPAVGVVQFGAATSMISGAWTAGGSMPWGSCFSTTTKLAAYSVSSVTVTWAVRPCASNHSFSSPCSTMTGLPLRRLAISHRPPAHGHAHAHADGLAEGLLGREARGEVAQAALGPARAARLPDRELGVAEHLAGKAFALALEGRGDATQVADVGANAVDHAAPAFTAPR